MAFVKRLFHLRFCQMCWEYLGLTIPTFQMRELVLGWAPVYLGLDGLGGAVASALMQRGMEWGGIVAGDLVNFKLYN